MRLRALPADLQDSSKKDEPPADQQRKTEYKAPLWRWRDHTEVRQAFVVEGPDRGHTSLMGA